MPMAIGGLGKKNKRMGREDGIRKDRTLFKIRIMAQMTCSSYVRRNH